MKTVKSAIFLAVILLGGSLFLASCSKNNSEKGSEVKDNIVKNGDDKGGDPTFTSVTDFDKWLYDQPKNTPEKPYLVRLNVKSLATVNTTLNNTKTKFVYLDLSGSSITTVSTNAFLNCAALTGITLPNSVESIEVGAFEGCENLTGVIIPNSVTFIGAGAFAKCTSLKGITIPDSVKSIGAQAFSGCSGLTRVSLGNNVKDIETETFMDCENLINITIPDSVSSIGVRAFAGCNNLTSITLPISLSSIGDRAFASCYSLTGITIPAKVTKIGNGAFANTNLSSIDVDTANTAYTSFNGVLYNKNKTILIICPSRKKGDFTIPNGVTGIGEDAFEGCHNLTSLVIPNTVTTIGAGTFYDILIWGSENPDRITTLPPGAKAIKAPPEIKGITSVTFQGSIPSSGFDTNAFSETDLRAKFYATNAKNGTPGKYLRSGLVWLNENEIFEGFFDEGKRFKTSDGEPAIKVPGAHND